MTPLRFFRSGLGLAAAASSSGGGAARSRALLVRRRRPSSLAARLVPVPVRRRPRTSPSGGGACSCPPRPAAVRRGPALSPSAGDGRPRWQRGSPLRVCRRCCGRVARPPTVGAPRRLRLGPVPRSSSTGGGGLAASPIRVRNAVDRGRAGPALLLHGRGGCTPSPVEGGAGPSHRTGKRRWHADAARGRGTPTLRRRRVEALRRRSRMARARRSCSARGGAASSWVVDWWSVGAAPTLLP